MDDLTRCAPGERGDAPQTHASEGFNKYGYPEFAGWSGERYLKKLLRQILPMALYRTWEIFIDHQPQGSECYLGVTRLADIAGRTTRTMEKNLATLCSRHLLVERAERKLMRMSDGTCHQRVVVVKDFAGLYALAHDYHEWTQAESYVAPDRGVISLVEQDQHLMAKVRRFENYRRVLCSRVPGRAAQPRTEDRWFTDYQPEFPGMGQQAPAAKNGISSHKGTTPSLLPSTSVSTERAEEPEKRIRETDPSLNQERESHESVASVPGSVFQDHHADAQAPSREALQRTETRERCSPPVGSTVAGERHAPSSWPASTASEEAACSVQGQAVSVLVDSFLAAIGTSFGDQNVKGTQTYLRRLLREAKLTSSTEILRCLLRAYLVARQTRTIRPEHQCPETGQVNRMPLFCAMVRQFAQERRQEHWWHASWPQVHEAMRADADLTRWWHAHQDLIADAAVVAALAPTISGGDLADGAGSGQTGTPLSGSQEALMPLGNRASPRASERRARAETRPKGSLALSVWSADGTDPYQQYIDALMAQYQAPVAHQEVQ